MSRKPLSYGFEPPADLFELATSVRAMIEKMLVIEHSHDEIVNARDAIDEIAARLHPIGRKGLLARLDPGSEAGPDDKRPYFAGDMERWHCNPLNPPVALEVQDGTVRGTCNLSLIWEGPPGCAHGGVVSMLLDQLLGQTNGANGVGAMTARLKVTYRRPTPLLTDLVLEAPPPRIIDARKCITRGTISAGGVVTAEAEGLFILPDMSKTSFPHLPDAVEQFNKSSEEES